MSMKFAQAFLPNCAYLRPDVVMLVSNDGWDIRALKQARSLAAEGLSVVMLGRRRYQTDLARFSDEFEIDILNVPMVIDDETMRLHLESGTWGRMRFSERVLSSCLLALFSLTNLKIKPKKVPPPIHVDVAKRLVLRTRMLSGRGSQRRLLVSTGRSPWISHLISGARSAYGGLRRWLTELTGDEESARTAARVIKYVILALFSPLIAAYIAIHFVLDRAKKAFVKGIRRVLNTRTKWLAPLRFLARKWTNLGRQVYRFARFFLYTVEYGETVARLKPRIIHAHDLYTLQAATRIASWIGAKVVYDAHELEADRRLGTDARMTRWIIEQEKRYASRATRCVTVSHAIAEEMTRTLRVKPPAVVFNAPITVKPPVSWKHRRLRADLGLAASVPLFVFVGKVYDLYGGNQQVGLIVEAIHRCPGFHLAIVGPIAPTAQQQLNELRQREDLADRLHLVPPIPAEAIVGYVADADVGIYLMWPDTRNIDLTIPNKLFELSLSGLPLVVSDLTSTRWFCEQVGNAALVTDRDPQKVAQICMEAYERREQLRPDKAHLDRLRTEFSWEAQGAKLVAVYDDLLERA